MSELIEREFGCPYCGEEITMLLDLSAGNQHYVEDCEVCCRPLTVSYTVRDGVLSEFSVAFDG